MPPRSRLSIAKSDIVKIFEEDPHRVFIRADIDRILRSNRQQWRLAQSTTTHQFIEYLVANTKMERHKINLPYRPTHRYTWGQVPTLEIVSSLRPDAYFTHFTAIYLHGLTVQVPKTIFLNYEQRASSTGGGEGLSQGAIGRAFKRKCRVSSNVTTFRDHRICLLNGQNTKQLGVEDIETSGAALRSTNIERTLIDITVRPIYSGGVFEVARTFAAAHDQFSVNRLISYLRRLNFTYPYHQAIGFYLQQTGKFTESQLSLFRNLEMHVDFYLTHDMKETDYVKEWRLFVPKGFQQLTS